MPAISAPSAPAMRSITTASFTERSCHGVGDGPLGRRASGQTCGHSTSVIVGSVLTELDLGDELELDELDPDDAAHHRADVVVGRVGHRPWVVVGPFEVVGQIADQTM